MIEPHSVCVGQLWPPQISPPISTHSSQLYFLCFKYQKTHRLTCQVCPFTWVVTMPEEVDLVVHSSQGWWFDLCCLSEWQSVLEWNIDPHIVFDGQAASLSWVCDCVEEWEVNCKVLCLLHTKVQTEIRVRTKTMNMSKWTNLGQWSSNTILAKLYPVLFLYSCLFTGPNLYKLRFYYWHLYMTYIRKQEHQRKYWL